MTGIDDILARLDELDRPAAPMRRATPEMVRAVGPLVAARQHVFPSASTAEAWAALIENHAAKPTPPEVHAACVALAMSDERYPIPAHVVSSVLKSRAARLSAIERVRYEIEVELAREVTEWTPTKDAEIQRRARELVNARLNGGLQAGAAAAPKPINPTSKPPTEGVREIAARVAAGMKEPSR